MPPHPSRRRSPRALLLFTVAAASACSADAPSLLRPASDAARRIQGLWWLLFGISLVAVLVVVGFLAVAVTRAGRDGDGVDRRPVPWGTPFVVVSGLVVSGAVLAGVFAVSLRDLDALAAPIEPSRLEIDVVAHAWWWEIRYPNGAVTANELHVPVGVPVGLRLHSVDVLHSFWVPRLQVKQDLVPGMHNHMWLQADEPGRYRGQCAEYCGLQHANMLFYVVAEPVEEFEAWVEAEAQPAAEPATARARRGRDLFVGASCAGCHAVRGEAAVGDLGPDLTHLAGRETIGAGVLPLTRDHLHAFTTDPQAAKPGVAMPPTELRDDEVDAVVDYLLSLE